MRKLLLTAILIFALPLFATGAEVIDRAANAKIRAEATSHSQVMRLLQVLSDRYTSRETGSPGCVAASRWAMTQLEGWGLKNVHLEPWDFGHPGWENVRAEAHLLAPEPGNLDVRVPSWTPSTPGTVKGAVVHLIPPAGSDGELKKWMNDNQSRIKGKIVMVGKAATPAYTLADQAVTSRSRYLTPSRRGGSLVGNLVQGLSALRGSRPSSPPIPRRPASDTSITQWLVAGGALARIYDGRGANGQIFETHGRAYDAAKALPAVIVSNESYGRIERLLASGEAVQLELNVRNNWYAEGKTCYNVVGEIPGRDRAGEIVMLGGHIDDWNMASGAMDNATGVATMMEVARIIQATGLKPRRTIRLALWSGEEQGLLGSAAYVRQHFGTFEDPKSEFGKLSAYFNIDMGTGRVTALNVFGTDAARRALADAMEPFRDLGTSGTRTALRGSAGSTDSSSFSRAGITAINMVQAPNDYGLTHHTNLDTYEHADLAQMIQGVVICAAAVWHTANRDAILPRYNRETMPSPSRGSIGTTKSAPPARRGRAPKGKK